MTPRPQRISARRLRRTRDRAAAAVGLAVQACGGPQSALHPDGPAAARIAELWWLMAGLGAAVAAIVIGLLAYAVLHHARRPAPADDREREPERSPRALRGVIVGGAVVPAVILLVVFTSTLRTLGALKTDRTAELHVMVDGRQFWWNLRYLDAAGRVDFTTANELHVPVGRTVRLHLVADDVIHSFWVPRLAGKLDLVPGDTTRMLLRADRAGTYRGQCAEYCGAQHARMAFLVVAEPADAYERWAGMQRLPAAEPATARARDGRRVFVESPCAECHVVRGVSEGATATSAARAGGRLGPDLTHLASRRTLAAGTTPNTRGHLGGWVGNPQGVKPGSFMPAVPIDAEEMIPLLDYLQTLR